MKRFRLSLLFLLVLMGFSAVSAHVSDWPRFGRGKQYGSVKSKRHTYYCTNHGVAHPPQNATSHRIQVVGVSRTDSPPSDGLCVLQNAPGTTTAVPRHNVVHLQNE